MLKRSAICEECSMVKLMPWWIWLAVLAKRLWVRSHTWWALSVSLAIRFLMVSNKGPCWKRNRLQDDWEIYKFQIIIIFFSTIGDCLQHTATKQLPEVSCCSVGLKDFEDTEQKILPYQKTMFFVIFMLVLLKKYSIINFGPS